LKKDKRPQNTPALDKARVLELLAQGANKRDLARKLGLKGSDRIQLKRLLKELQAEGVIEGSPRKGFTKHGELPEAGLIDVTWEDHLAQLSFFVKSPVLFARAVVPGMQARRFGRIIHIDSEVAHRPPPGRSAYATAKSAQIGLARSWAGELAPFGITVNTVAPGFVPVERHADVPAKVKDAYIASVPARRMGTPDEIAHAVSFLASEQAGFITGQRVVVDGGRGLGA